MEHALHSEVMPIRFPVKAANADILGDDAPNEAGASPEPPPSAGDKRDIKIDPYARTRESWRQRDEGKPGQDINAAGFIKGKETPAN